ncbi:hypothetical protein POM88_051586 [Heracleum sosnowskyi]|uniref:Uncharacterized protein n=1 Tax=Heracleum sosnowskyi TaxID=360622 RepID=A0AAD8H284_9APIA|nr:hypothetical protein POM88_051586 [Heracleum sosnowskyi]
MHEYSLSGINVGLDSADIIVLCKITYDSSKECPIDLKSGAKFAGDVTSISSEVDDKEEIINTILEGVISEPTENLTVIDGDVDDRSTATQDLDAFDAIIESISQEDLDLIMEYINSNPQNEPVEKNSEENSMSNLGKRKSEAEENSLRNKKACIF